MEMHQLAQALPVIEYSEPNLDHIESEIKSLITNRLNQDINLSMQEVKVEVLAGIPELETNSSFHDYFPMIFNLCRFDLLLDQNADPREILMEVIKESQLINTIRSQLDL